MTGAPRPAVVLGYHRGGLALSRGLGRAGAPVYGLGAYPSVGYPSRYLRDRLVAEWRDGEGPDRGLLEGLHRLAGHGRPVLFPDNDDGVAFVLEHWDEVRALADVPLPDDPDVVRRLDRKDLLPGVAAGAGVPSPATVRAGSEEEVRAAGLRFPVLIKAVEGKRFVHLFRRKAFVADDVDAALDAWRRADAEGIETIVQELIPDAAGSIWSLYAYVDGDGEALGAVVGRKLRELPPTFGSSTVFEARWDDRVYETGMRLLRHAGYRGLAHVELAHDRRDDSLQLIEVNTRVPVWGAIAAGRRLNLAKIAYDDLCGNPAKPLQTLARPVYWIDLQEELDRLVRVPVWPGAFVRPYLGPRKVPALFALDDPWPGLAAAGRYVHRRTVREPVHAARRWLRTRPAVARLRRRLR